MIWLLVALVLLVSVHVQATAAFTITHPRIHLILRWPIRTILIITHSIPVIKWLAWAPLWSLVVLYGYLACMAHERLHRE